MQLFFVESLRFMELEIIQKIIMNGTKEFVNSAYNGDVEGGNLALSTPPSAPYRGGQGSSKMSPWVMAWITFSTILGILGLILGAYATAEVNSFNDTAKRSEQELIQIVSNSMFKASADGSRVGKKVNAAGWTEHPDLDLARSDGGAVAYNNKVYMFGGLRLDDPSANPPGMILKTLVEYDPSTRQHRQLSDMPGPRYRMAYAQLDGKIYVFGGFDKFDTEGADHSTPKSTMVYDIDNDSWTDLGDSDNHMNVLRSDSCGAAANGKIYAFGGYEHQNDFATSTAIEEFDPTTGQWRELSTTLKHARGDCKAVTVDNKIYVLGGAAEASGTRFGVNCDNLSDGDDWRKCYYFSTVNEMFDPATSSVSDMAPMNVGRGDLGVAVKPNGNILVAGGEVARPSLNEFNQVATDRVEEYDVASNTWTDRAPLTQAKFRHSMTMAGNRIIVLGGHPTCTEGIVQCMQGALKSVLMYNEFPSLWLTESGSDDSGSESESESD